MNDPKFFFEVRNETTYSNLAMEPEEGSRVMGTWLDGREALAFAERNPEELPGIASADHFSSDDLPLLILMVRVPFGERNGNTALVARFKWDIEHPEDEDGEVLEDDYIWTLTSRMVRNEFIPMEMP